MLKCPVILSTDEYFPEPFDASEDSARILFVRTCRYMGLDPAGFDLGFYRTGPAGKYNPCLARPAPDWLGLYEGHSQHATIWVETTHLDDPESLVATFAHELGHACLLGQQRIGQDARDLEPLTDLATVFFGLGIFTANVSFRSRSYYAGYGSYWTTSSQGYLTPPMWSYALALFAWLREEEKPPWMSLLHASVRLECREALAYLRKTGDARVLPGQPVDESGPFSASEDSAEPDSPSAACNRGGQTDSAPGERLETGPEDEEEPDAEGQIPSDADPALLADPLGDPFTRGVLSMQEGNWQEAIDAFSEAIRREPDDGESYQQRSLAYLELGYTREAIADAETAVRLDPEDPEAYFARGVAQIQAHDYARAIDDLSRYLDDEDIRQIAGAHASKAHYFRGLAYAAQRELRDAVADYTTAISRWPNWPEPYEARAAAYEQLGYPEKAIADREEAEWRAQR